MPSIVHHEAFRNDFPLLRTNEAEPQEIPRDTGHPQRVPAGRGRSRRRPDDRAGRLVEREAQRVGAADRAVHVEPADVALAVTQPRVQASHR